MSSSPKAPSSAAPAAESAVTNLSPLRRAILQMEKMEAKIASLERARTEPIAVVGLGCRYPGGADSPEAFWQLLKDGVDAVTEVPASRWSVQRGDDSAEPARRGLRWGGFLKEPVDRFDRRFFNISPREAASMDPQQRLVLEVAWEALEHAGQAPDRLMGTRAGVFLGVVFNDYRRLNDRIPREALDIYNFTGNLSCFPAGRLSYVLGLEGPSLSVDTACSSSLVAIHLACQSLRLGECTLALAGGVNVMLDPSTMDLVGTMQALAPDGRCKTFDARANGFVRGEGCGVVVLKRLSDAQADGDTILALVRGSAVNQDGRSTGLTAPNVLSQQAMLRKALESGGVAPSAIGYVETHGTGTPLGDPIEIEALKDVVGAPRADGSVCALGAVKTNLGHLEAAAGVAGFTKAVLALHHQAIPGSLHFRTLNPRISFEGTPFVIPTEEIPWRASDKPRFAGVSSFGLSGTNAHVILEEAPRPAAMTQGSASASAAYLLPLSAKSPEALRSLAEAYQRALAALPEEALPDACYTASVGRSHEVHRLAVVGRDAREIRGAIDAHLRGEPHPAVASGSLPEGARPRVVFVFPGQGSQWLGMGRELLRAAPVFRRALEACDHAIHAETGWSVIEELAADPSRSRLDRIDVVQPVLFAVEVALAELLRGWGVVPSAVVGHSMGEVAAAHVAGALRLADAARIICQRSRLLLRVTGKGAMALVELPVAEAEEALRGREDKLSVGVSNGPRSTVLSGDPAAMEEVLRALEQRGVFCRRVKVDVASHSPQMDPLLDDLSRILAGIVPTSASIPMHSTVTGQIIDGAAVDNRYWARNLRDRVLFADAVRQLADAGHHVFLELSPHPILLPAIEQGLTEAGVSAFAALPSLRRNEPETACLLRSFGALYALGFPVDFQRLYPAGGRRISLPRYPWQRERLWLDAATPTGGASEVRRARAPGASGHPMLSPHLRSASSGAIHWEIELSPSALPYLGDHRVRGMIVLPASAYLELALAGAREVFGDGPCALADVRFKEVLHLPDDSGRLAQVIIARDTPTAASFEVYSAAEGGAADEATAWSLHASGTLRLGPGERRATAADEPVSALNARCAEILSTDQHADEMRRRGLEYGPAFRGVTEIRRRPGEAVGRVRLPEEAGTGSYKIHPALLDAALQVYVAALGASGDAASPDDATYLPVGLSALRVHAPLPSELWAHARLAPREGDASTARRGDVDLLDTEGRVLLEVSGLRVERLARATSAADLRERGPRRYETIWETADLSPAEPQRSPRASGVDERWILLSDRGGVGAELKAELEARGATCVVVSAGERFELHGAGRYTLEPSRPDDFHRLIEAEIGPDRPVVTGIAHLFALDVEPLSDSFTASWRAAERLICGSALHLVQALARDRVAEPPRVWLITRGAQATSAKPEAVSVAQAPLWGLGRVIAQEHPELRCSLMDLDPTGAKGEAAALAGYLLSETDEAQIALRGGSPRVARLVERAPAAKADRAAPTAPAGDQPFRLEIQRPGSLDALTLRATPRRSPEPGEVEIEVHAAGLNFLDVLMALGVLSDDEPGSEESGPRLGAECAGTIVAVGEGVADLSVGQEVIAFARGCFGATVTTHALSVVEKPKGLSFAEAATLPVAFLTARQALLHAGKLAAGERVLIHAAAGGVGLAAIQIARLAGAEIFATAGSPEKRDYLRSLGIEHVMDSRSLSFAEDVMAATSGEGVDVILNSLAGDFIDAGLSVLRDEGRFVEIGKRDYYQNRRLGLRPFLKSLTFTLVDLRSLRLRRPAFVRDELSALVRSVEAGTLKPLPHRVLPAARAADAFYEMAQGKHTGKLVLSFADRASTPIAIAPAAAPIRADGSYLITGGLGGLGLSVAHFLVERGARHLVLMGTRGAATEAARAAVEALSSAGAEVLVERADVSDEAAVARVLAAIPRDRQLRGVIHAAGVIDDAPLAQTTLERVERVMAPKIAGAFNLHRLTLSAPLDFFVLFSSAAAVLGSAAQGGYAAANAFMDALAHHRRSLGRPALSIQWGPWSEVGLAAREDVLARFMRLGLASMTTEEGILAFERLLGEDVVEIAVTPLNAERWCRAHPSAGTARLFAHLLGERREGDGAGEAPSFRQALTAAPPGRARRARLESHLCGKLAEVLRLSPSEINPTTPLRTLGLDSLMSLEFGNRVGASLDLKLSATLVWNHPTIAAIAEFLAHKMGIPLEPTEAAAREPSTSAGAVVRNQVLSAIKDLPENDVEALLLEELRDLGQ